HTEALQKEFNLTYEEAERLKRGEALDKVRPEEAHPVMLNASQEIFTEVSRSMDYFRSSSQQPEIREVILSGGSALVQDFAARLSEKIGVQVSPAEPFRNIHIPSKFDSSFIEEVAPIAAVAVGLAMRRQGDR
ncbi:MAG TPA: pilus assembly protein PilM, partial [Thermodesulfovibrionales bacterium]|nr:pilus assembly protein PilM [Thermodesulfovibrionales bacterium]